MLETAELLVDTGGGGCCTGRRHPARGAVLAVSELLQWPEHDQWYAQYHLACCMLMLSGCSAD